MPVFFSYNEGSFSIKPKLTDIGDYSVYITLTDDNIEPLTNKVLLFTSVIPQPKDTV